MARKTPPVEVELEQVRDPQTRMTFFRVSEPVTISPSSKFAIVPGPKGQGWMLQVIEDARISPA